MITSFESIENHRGTRENVDFRQLTDRIENTDAIICSLKITRSRRKWEQRGWSAATFTGDVRSKTSVERVSMLVYDIDSKETRYSHEMVFDALCGHSCFIHTTASHSEMLPRYRLICQLTRDVSPTEYGRLWSRYAIALSKCGIRPDTAVREAGKFWFSYTPVIGLEYATYRQHGVALDPDVIRGIKDVVK